MIRIGTAGWTIPRSDAAAFAGEGTHLERYARVLDAAEINSSFHRRHRVATYERWAASVSATFRFSVKLPKTITHTAKLLDCATQLDELLSDAAGLGDRLGCVLVQLPPSLAFDGERAAAFFGLLRDRWSGSVACEPRHVTWLEEEADQLMARHEVARVAADPPVAGAGDPGGWRGLEYWRLHGSPRTYYSSYDRGLMEDTVARIGGSPASDVWCIFDNTASGAAAGNALEMAGLVSARA